MPAVLIKPLYSIFVSGGVKGEEEREGGEGGEGRGEGRGGEGRGGEEE